MAWSDWLTPDETRQLLSRYPGSLDEIAIAAMEKPRYACEFARLGAWVQTYEEHMKVVEMPGVVVSPEPPEEFPRVIVRSAREQAFVTLVVAAMLEDGELAPTKDDLVGGRPYLKADYEAAGKLHASKKMTVEGIERRRELSTRRAWRIYRQFHAGAVVWDGVGLHPGRGYRWDPRELDNDPPRYRLIRA
jgi:hypothetical protein